ncbi:MAG: VIT domain-containing protein [Archangium sp.]|nr:VIT domain-containing protein [Archangium sp.]
MHPSPFALEQLLAGQASSEVTSHLLVCEACRAQLSEMERAAKTFSASPRSLRAKDAAARADQRWKQRAAALTLVPAALLAVFAVSALTKPPEPAPIALKAAVNAPKLRQGREVLEVRQEPWRTNLRSIPLRGHNVEFGQGSLEASTDDGPARPFTLEHTKVDIDVTGFMQAVTVTQTFTNPFRAPVEALYVFPLPDDSAVHDMTMTAGNRVIRANIQKRAVARQQYEQAKAEGRRAALLDQERPNIFTQSLANLLPGEKVQVTLQYVAPLRYDDGVYTLNFPMVVGPRYLPGSALPGESQGSGTKLDTDVVPDGSRISPPEARSGRDIEVAVRLNAGTVIEDLWSVSHRLEVDRPSSSQLSLSLNPMDTLPNKDLIVRWRVSGVQARAAVLAAGGAFALMLNPESKDLNVPPTPKEMVFVIDTSCSMNGAPLNAAKRAMTQALQQMNADDTFMLIDFADNVSSFYDGPLSATPNDVRRAIAYLNALPSGGGTNQLAGIRRALGGRHDPKRLRMVLLMTDGFIGNEEEILAETRRLRGDARVFGFGIGSSVNHFLLSRLSEEGRGFYQYLRPDEDANEAVNRFTRRIARPLITDITIDWGGLEVADLTPAQVPDLFDVQPLIINGRYRKPGAGTVVLRGKRGGFPVVFEAPVTLPELSTNGRALQMAWARRRIEALGAVQYNIAPPEVVEQITALGLEFHLVTKYTSLVAVEDAPVTNVPAVTVTEPTLTADQTTPVGGRYGGAANSGVLGYKGPPATGEGQADLSLQLSALQGDSGGVVLRAKGGGTAYGTGGLGLRGTGAGGGGVGGLGTLGAGRGRGVVAPITANRVVISPDQLLGGDGDRVTTTTKPSVVKLTPTVPVADPAKAEPPPPQNPYTDPKADALAFMLADKQSPPPVAAPRPGPDPKPTDDEPEDEFASSFGGAKRALPKKDPPGYIPPAPGGSTADVKESLGQTDIMEVVLANKAALAACVERQHRLAPGTSGKLLMKWIIETNGRTNHVTVASEEWKSSPIATCVAQLIKVMKFPKHKQRGEFITFPFKF